MRKQKNFSKIILLGITGYKENHWRNKLKEIDKFKISKASLFLERFNKTQREKIYQALLVFKIKDIPLVHLRHDMTKEELGFLARNFGSRYFTIHEDTFKIIKKWKGFYKKLFLEMNVDSFISKSVNVKKIGGFCVDLAHFKIEAIKWSKEFDYIFKRKNFRRYFKCNHLNGYSPKKNMDMHKIKSLKDFNYFITLPKFVFGNIIALEVDNSIAEQLKFKKYLVNFFKNKV